MALKLSSDTFWEELKTGSGRGGEKINKPLAGKQRKDFKERKTLND